MKQKKGFTLIEVIVTISLLALISTIILLSISSARDKHNEEEWLDLTARIKSAASVYVDKSEGLKSLIYSGTTVYVAVEDLLDSGLLDENYIYDPTDGVSVLDKENVVYQSVKVFLNANDAIEYVYPAYTTSYVTISPTRVNGYTDTAIDYLDGVRVYNDNGIEVDNTVLTDITKTGGKLYPDTHTVVFPTAGEYTLTYTFNNISYNRTYYISVLSGEVVDPTPPEQLINPDQVYNEPGEYTYQTVLEGTYTIRAYGAEGGNSGGKGGYVSGNIYLGADSTLTLIVGGTPTSDYTGGYNGGGTGTYGGGGATIVKLNGVTIMTAAGGGGGSTGGAGGEGNAAGGAAVETDTELETVALETAQAGSSGTLGGGGGSGNKYAMCLEYEQVYDSCVTTTNTCSYGCDTCSRAVYQYCCDTDGSTECFEQYHGCYAVGDCSACSIVRWETYSCDCSDCFYGSPTTCVGGYVDGSCTSLDSTQTKPGVGGTSSVSSSFTDITMTSGLKEDDGLIEIKLISEGSGS
ncbi:MAG TPA: glycine-rich protein [Bacilli bacterium]|nr:glycine-rich protein [Bacilli bacterium]